MARSWTDEQRLAIDARNNALLVSAAAGSGKTSVLVERVLRLLTDEKNPLSPQRLAVVTFTNAAADEMRQRLQTGLTALLREEPENAFLAKQQMLLQSANISTIHAFCLELVRANFHLLGISPSFRIADEDELSVLRGHAMEELFEDAYASRPELIQPLAAYFWQGDDSLLEEHIAALYRFSCSLPFADVWFEEALAAYEPEGDGWLSLLLKRVEGLASFAARLLTEAIVLLEASAPEASAVQTLEQERSIAHHVIELAGQEDWDALCSFAEGIKFGRLMTAKLPLSPIEIDRVKALRTKAKELLGKGLSGLLLCSEEEHRDDLVTLAPVLRGLITLTQDFSMRFRALKEERGVIDFSDAEHFAVTLLAQNVEGRIVPTELAQELSAYYEEVVIDEYQDVNALQSLIFTMLSDGGKKIFAVGDVKQSIYRFREANPELFLRLRERAKPYEEDMRGEQACILLFRNFRSRPEVTEAVNFFFGRLMTKEAAELDYGEDERLIPAAEYPPSPACRAEMLLCDAEAVASEDAKEALPREAIVVAARIRTMLDEGYPVADGKGGMRPCRPRDFCILLRSANTRGAPFEEALKRIAVHAVSGETKGYFASREISVMLSLLRVLDNPLRDIPLAAVMFSPMFLFSADDMAEIRLQSKGPLYLAVTEAARGESELAVRCAKLLEDLGVLREYAAANTIERLIRRIYDSTDFLAVVRVLDSGEQKRANLHLLLEYAARFEQNGGLGLSAFLRHIDRVLEQKQDVAQASVVSEAEDAVRILTIHKSKGLEFPVCIVADCGKEFNMRGLNSELQLHADLGIGIKRRQPELLKRYATAPYEVVRAVRRRNLISEEMRLLYVAMTRAKEKLILSMAVKNLPGTLSKLAVSIDADGAIAPFAVGDASSYADWLLAAMLTGKGGERLRLLAGMENIQPLDDGGIAVWLDGEDESFPMPSLAVQQEKIFHATPDDTMVEELEHTLSFQYPHAPLTQLPAKLAVTELVRSESGEVRLLKRPRFLAREGLSGAERGNALHKFMQYADYQSASSDPAPEAVRLVREGFLTQREADAVNLDRVKAFFASDLGARLLASPRICREYKFLAEIPASEYDPLMEEAYRDEPIFIQGIADCLFEEDGRLVIIDYKTDYVQDGAELVASYGRQLSLYREALAKILGMPVKECVLYSFRLSEAIVVEPQKKP